LILYINSQSILSKIDELACIANDMKPDLILLTESWCREEISNAYLQIPGFDLQPELRMDRLDTTAGVGGGLLVYGKKGLQIIPCKNKSDFNQHCSFKVKCGRDETTVMLVYRPPKYTAEVLLKLENFLNTVEERTVLIGDFNLPDIDWQEGMAGSNAARRILEKCDDKFLEQMVLFPTHKCGNVLDLVLTNIPEEIRNVEAAGSLGTSDHVMLAIKIAGSPDVDEDDREVFNWWKADWQGMRHELSSENTWDELAEASTEESWRIFKQKIDEVTERYVPKKKRNTGSRPIWMSQHLLREIRRKRRLWKVQDSQPTREYKEAQKRVKKLIRNAKRKMENKLAFENNGNSKPFFAYLKSKLKSRVPVGPLKDSNGRPVTDKEDMAKLLNGYFSTVFTDEDVNDIPDTAARTDSVLENVEITEEKVKTKIMKIKTSSAPGPDGIGAMILQQLKDQVAPALQQIFEKTLNTGEVPADWKRANVTPIFKKGSKAEPGNYRPVSLTTISCKILETIIRDDIVDHLVDNNLLEKSQHGFVPGRSCATNLIEFLDKVTEAVDGGHGVDLIFLDFAKAFDTVPKHRLIAKLKARGVRGKVLNWIEEWLTGREQRVVINGKKSGWEKVRSGVPQGSVLGPILFLIFISDLDEAAHGGTSVAKFADDTKLAQVIRAEQDRENLQRSLEGMQSWADKWGMRFNVAKCKIMQVGRGNGHYNYQLAGTDLTHTEEERDIGVLVSKNLKPGAQCCKAARTATTVLGQITRSFKCRDKKTYIALYKRYVRPHLEFSVQAWNPWLQKDIAVLEKVQERAVRQVNGLHGRTYEQRLTEIGMESLKERREEADMILVYKVMNGKCKVDKYSWFEIANPQMDIERMRTRGALDDMQIRSRRTNLETRTHFFTQRVCEKWNGLPYQTRKAKSVATFRREYRRIKNGATTEGGQYQYGREGR
jgi:Reverse transcriptase (RNA-dependent DNA polymerase)/Endonuclease-reverse transcriptase